MTYHKWLLLKLYKQRLFLLCPVWCSSSLAYRTSRMESRMARLGWERTSLVALPQEPDPLGGQHGLLTKAPLPRRSQLRLIAGIACLSGLGSPRGSLGMSLSGQMPG